MHLPAAMMATAGALPRRCYLSKSLLALLAFASLCRDSEGLVMRSGLSNSTNSTEGIAYFSTPNFGPAPNATATTAHLTGAAALNASSSFSTTNSSRQSRAPRVYFMFLAVDKVSNLDVWKAFLAAAPPSQYKAFVHCKLPSCQQQVAGSVIQAVHTVPSYYCTDLVSPMQQMVYYALQDPDGLANPYDKFAFVSDSSLPAKPFSYVYSTLSSRLGSDFCIFPSGEWADVPSSSGYGLEIAVKSHQWVTLNRAHAEKSWELWRTGTLHNFMPYFRMNSMPMLPSNNSYADQRNYGCLDEFWYMIALFGTLHQPNAQQVQDVHLPLFTGSTMHISNNAGWQGECDTFVLWSKYLYTWGNNPFNSFYSTLDAASTPHGGNFARPGWWDTISTHGLRAIRHSPFLFVRKFIDNPRLADGPNFVQAYVANVLW